MRSTPSSVAKALKATLDLYEVGVDLMRQNMRRNHPGASDREIDQLVREWLRQRPGAEKGDSSGRPVDIPGRLA